MFRAMNLLRFWTRFQEPVDRRQSWLFGLVLTLTKYVGDGALVFLGTGRLWTPLDYLASVRTLFATVFQERPALAPAPARSLGRFPSYGLASP